MSDVEQLACPDCGGSGDEGVVTRWMAMDAGEPAMEGMTLHCRTCDGDGWVLAELDDAPPGDAA